MFLGVYAQRWLSQALLGVGAGCALGTGFPPSSAMTAEDWVGDVFHQLVLLPLCHASFIFARREDPHFRKDPVRLPSRTWVLLGESWTCHRGLAYWLLSGGNPWPVPSPNCKSSFHPGEEGPESPLPWLGALSCLSPRLSHAGLHSHWLLETQGGYSPSDGCREMGRGCRKG